MLSQLHIYWVWDVFQTGAINIHNRFLREDYYEAKNKYMTKNNWDDSL